MNVIKLVVVVIMAHGITARSYEHSQNGASLSSAAFFKY